MFMKDLWLTDNYVNSNAIQAIYIAPHTPKDIELAHSPAEDFDHVVYAKLAQYTAVLYAGTHKTCRVYQKRIISKLNQRR